jgi:hypothetical protein
MDPPVALDPVACLVPKGLQAARASQVQMVATGRRARRVRMARWVLTERMARSVLPALLAQLVRRDLKVTVASLSCRFISTHSNRMST